jgi:hypothetical protein
LFLFFILRGLLLLRGLLFRRRAVWLFLGNLISVFVERSQVARKVLATCKRSLEN